MSRPTRRRNSRSRRDFPIPGSPRIHKTRGRPLDASDQSPLDQVELPRPPDDCGVADTGHDLAARNPDLEEPGLRPEAADGSGAELVDRRFSAQERRRGLAHQDLPGARGGVQLDRDVDGVTEDRKARVRRAHLGRREVLEPGMDPGVDFRAPIRRRLDRVGLDLLHDLQGRPRRTPSGILLRPRVAEHREHPRPHQSGDGSPLAQDDLSTGRELEAEPPVEVFGIGARIAEELDPTAEHGDLAPCARRVLGEVDVGRRSPPLRRGLRLRAPGLDCVARRQRVERVEQGADVVGALRRIRLGDRGENRAEGTRRERLGKGHLFDTRAEVPREDRSAGQTLEENQPPRVEVAS